jgi:HK97 family phage portal protein
MNIFKRFFREATVSATKDIRGGTYCENKVFVRSDQAAMKIAAVYRAVYLISSGAAVLEMEYKRRDRFQDYFKGPDTKSPGDEAVRRINFLLQKRPNERMNSYVFFKNMVEQVLLKGNAYIWPDVDEEGNVHRLILCQPGSVAYDVYNNVYHIADTINKVSGTFRAEQVLHIKNVTVDGGYTGLSTIHYAATTLGIAATADSETWKRFSTGGRIKAILQGDKAIRGYGEAQDEQMEKMKDDLQDNLNRGDDILFLKGDGTLTPIGMTSADMQFLESRKFTIREIARFFNIPPSKLMDDTNSNYKSTEMSNIQFYVEALQPIITEVEREFNAKLVPSNVTDDYKFAFNLEKLYALDLDSRSRWNKSLIETGLATINDIRRKMDLPPVEGGDETYLSVNLAPIGSAKLRGK